MLSSHAQSCPRLLIQMLSLATAQMSLTVRGLLGVVGDPGLWWGL